MASIYTPQQRLFLIALTFAVTIATFAFSRHEHYSRKMNACFIYREVERPGATWIPIRDSALHNYSVYAMWSGMLLLALLPGRRAKGVFSLLYASVWFHTTYVLLAALKALIEDVNCAGRHADYPNGISGHYCYFVFVTLTVPVLAHARLRANPSAPPAVLAPAHVLLLLYLVGAGATLYRTYFHGYHSAQQILLGSALGLAAHLALETFAFSGIVRAALLAQVAVLAANSGLAFAMYYALWPTAQAGPAISQGHVYFHGALYAGLSLTGLLMTQSDTVKSPEPKEKPEAAKA